MFQFSIDHIKNIINKRNLNFIEPMFVHENLIEFINGKNYLSVYCDEFIDREEIGFVFSMSSRVSEMIDERIYSDDDFVNAWIMFLGV